MDEFQDQPFVMLGINVNPHEPSTLKQVMSKEQLPWRTFADQGAAARQWNLPPTPAYYVLDQHGVIRHKWLGHPGEKLMDAKLKALIAAAAKQ